jgi:hypothetical protein
MAKFGLARNRSEVCNNVRSQLKLRQVLESLKVRLHFLRLREVSDSTVGINRLRCQKIFPKCYYIEQGNGSGWITFKTLSLLCSSQNSFYNIISPSRVFDSCLRRFLSRLILLAFTICRHSCSRENEVRAGEVNSGRLNADLMFFFSFSQ